jgi:hypothetical protein
MASNLDFGLYQNDLITQDGDFVITESDTQHVSDTLAAFPGWWKEHPADGVGVLQYVNSTGAEQTLERSIKLQLESDGYRCSNPEVDIDNEGNLTVSPNAEKV